VKHENISFISATSPRLKQQDTTGGQKGTRHERGSITPSTAGEKSESSIIICCILQITDLTVNKEGYVSQHGD